MDNRRLIKIAKIFSTIFMPLYAPLWVFFGLFLFSYMRMLPWGYKLFIIGLVYVFAVFIPTLGITTFRLFKKWTHLELSHREHRHMPYLVTLLSYGACLVIIARSSASSSMLGGKSAPTWWVWVVWWAHSMRSAFCSFTIQSGHFVPCCYCLGHWEPAVSSSVSIVWRRCWWVLASATFAR